MLSPIFFLRLNCAYIYSNSDYFEFLTVIEYDISEYLDFPRHSMSDTDFGFFKRV